jgi:TolB-like protein/Flp pilus assembly protein TadD
MSTFLQRLRKRKLVQWVLAYVAAAFALIQVMDIVGQRFGWPEPVVRGAIIALAVGFFVTIVLAWYHGEKGAQRVTGTELLILALLLTIGGGLLWRLGGHEESLTDSRGAATTGHPSPSRPIDEKSVAVLPFENLSDEKANGYFATGIQDEILTRLAKIGALKVISRTSTQHYSSSPDNLPEIARQLGVANVLEGSVQKAGEVVHVNVQLIRAATDEHLWAETYNRKLDDIFGVEAEVAQAIAETLRAKLSGAEAAQVAAKPTSNPAAYDAYLRGLEAYNRTFGVEQLKTGSQYFTQATQLDPDFALAWVHLSDVDGLMYFQAVDHSDARLQSARRAMENAMRLAPDSGEAWLAKGWFLYHTLDYDGAGAALAEAAQRLPNSSEVLSAQGYLERRRGHYERACEFLERSLERDPQNMTQITSVAETRVAIGQYAVARSWAARAQALRPGDPTAVLSEVNAWIAEGDLDRAGKLLEPMPLQLDEPASFGYQTNYFFLRRRYGDVIKAVTAAMAAPGYVPSGYASWYYPQLAWAQRWSGDEKSAQATFAEGKRRLEALRTASNDNGYVASNLAWIEAGLGNADAAEREGRRSIELTGPDQFNLSSMLQNVAEVEALAGRKEQALATLDELMKSPVPVPQGDLRYGPWWDPLRKDPRFQRYLSAQVPGNSGP